MSNQNQQITGHRQLSQAEIDNINNLRSLASQLDEFIGKIKQSDYVDKRLLAIAENDLKKGFMCLAFSLVKSSS